MDYLPIIFGLTVAAILAVVADLAERRKPNPCEDCAIRCKCGAGE
jgi:hypothetical protein